MSENNHNIFIEQIPGEQNLGYDVTFSKFLNFNANGTPNGVYDWGIFDFLTQREHIKVIGGIPYIFDCGVFKADYTGSKLKTMIRDCILPKYRKSSTIKRVYDLFIQADELNTTFDNMNQYEPYCINFKNGFLNVKTMELLPPDPKFLATNQIPYNWNHKRSEPKTAVLDNWFKELFQNDDDKEMFLQYAGLCLTRDTRQQKFLILKGEGGTGKSVLINLVQTAVGSENTSNVSLEDLQQRFSTFSLMGKLLNCCADLKISVLDNPAKLKQLTGEDSMTAEQKGKDLVSFRNYSKQLFSANDLPYIRNERTGAFYRRLMILEINKKPLKPDIELSEKVCENVEYFIYLCVQALNRMYNNSGILSESNRSKELVQEMQEKNDVVQAFLNDDTHIEPGKKEDRNKLYQRFEHYCIDQERAPLPKNKFYEDLRLKGYSEVKNDGLRYFKNLKLNYEFVTRT